MKPTKRPAEQPPLPLLLVVALALALALPGCGRQGKITETVSGEWAVVYFTAPAWSSDQVPTMDEEVVALIGESQESVDVAAYDLELDSVADALIHAHQNGARVRLITDATNADEAAVARLHRAGVPVMARPEGRGIMHDKFFVVDGRWVWTGSWNPTENGTYRNDNNALLIASRALAQDYTAEFEEMFEGYFGPGSPANTPYPLVRIEGLDRPVQVEVYFAPEDGVADRLLQLLSSARSHIRFLAFQFTDPRLADALIDRVEEGIAVQGVMEARAAEGPYSQCDRLREGGVEVFLDGNPYTMHHKVLIIDDQTVVVGSYNFTISADEENDENLLIIHDPEVARAFLAEFERVLQQARGTCF